MASLFRFFGRLYTSINPPSAQKGDDVLRFGLLGASNIAPLAVILPARSHPEVVIHAVAARDRKKAEAYAKKHSIPVVHGSYEDLLKDESVSCVYIALPNGLHFEWALRCLQAGKHVLLEKPSCSNAAEAKILFNHPLLKAPNAPVLLEAFHYRFHPAWQTLLSIIRHDPEAGAISHASVTQTVFKGLFPISDNRFNFELAGGTLMDFGTYSVSSVRSVFDAEPSEVVEASHRKLAFSGKGEQPQPEIDEAINATYKFANGGTAKIYADLRATSSWNKSLPGGFAMPKLTADLAEKTLPNDLSGPDAENTHRVQRSVIFWNYMMPTFYHRIDVVDTHTLERPDGSVAKTWKTTKYHKYYNWPEKGEGKVGEDWWTTYRHQLEEFTNRIKGRKGSGVWIDHDESIRQMTVIDDTYKKAGLSVRPTSSFKI